MKPHSNDLIAAWELHKLRQGSLSLEEYIARLRILVKKANYPVEQHERFLGDFLVLELRPCAKGPLQSRKSLTFKEAYEMAKSEESADKQLQLTNTKVVLHSINTSRGYQSQRNQRRTPTTGSGKPQACRNCDWDPHSESNAQQVMLHATIATKWDTWLRYVCQSRKRKMCMTLKLPAMAHVSRYQTQVRYPVITCFWAQLVQHH